MNYRNLDNETLAIILDKCSNPKGQRCSECPVFGKGDYHCASHVMKEASKRLKEQSVRYGHWTIDLHHYFEDKEFGDLIFYANICCSECGKKITSIYGDTIENPCVSYEDYWSINPLDLYEEQYNKIKNILSLITLENYCPSCGCKMIKEDEDE